MRPLPSRKELDAHDAAQFKGDLRAGRTNPSFPLWVGLSLTTAHWWPIAFTILVTIPVALGFAFVNPIYSWYLRQFVEPGLERDLGFRGGTVTVVDSGRPYEWWGIVSVTSGGEFERAGVRAGDIPVGYHHGVESGFISELDRARGASVTLDFATGRTAHSTQHPNYKKVTIVVPQRRAA